MDQAPSWTHGEPQAAPAAPAATTPNHTHSTPTPTACSRLRRQPTADSTDPSLLRIDDDDRYGRLRLISWWRQERLAAASVLVVGAGALGNEVIKNLALLGVGTTYLIDLDVVEASNLSRSVLFRAEDGGQPKATAAARRACELNPEITVVPMHGDVHHRSGTGALRRRRPGHRLPRQPRGPALGQPPVLESRNSLDRCGHSRDSRGGQGLRPARFGLL